jgi:hypothetical protein
VTAFLKRSPQRADPDVAKRTVRAKEPEQKIQIGQ